MQSNFNLEKDIFELRISKLKARVNRRLRKLARWVDLPERSRQPLLLMPTVSINQKVGKTSRACLPHGISEVGGTRNIFIPDNSVRKGNILPDRLVTTSSHSQNTPAVTITGNPSSAFKPGDIMKQVNDILSQQKKEINDVIKGQSKDLVPTTNKLQESSTAISIDLPVRKTENAVNPSPSENE